MDLDQATEAAGVLFDRAPGQAQNNLQRRDARLAQLVGVLQDLIPGGELWRLMARRSDDTVPEGAVMLDWGLAVLDDAALYRILLLEANDEHGGLRVPVLRIPFELITVVSVTDIRSHDHGAQRLQRFWQFNIGRDGLTIEEDRILGTVMDSDDRFAHELIRRAGWPVNEHMIES
jgi:hypothetical protein